MGIVMSSNEEKAVVFKILSLYIITTGIFLVLFFGFYYSREYYLLLHQKSNDLKQDYSSLMRLIDKKGKFDLSIVDEMKKMDLDINFAIYDKKYDILYNNLDIPLDKTLSAKKKGFNIINGYVIMDSPPLSYHKYSKKDFNKSIKSHPSLAYHIIMKGSYIDSDIWWLRVRLVGFLLLSLMIVSIIAYFLLQLSLKPLKNKIVFLNRFIKDTTHEINTPISIILMSIERLQKKELSSENEKKINRIYIAAKTLANIYQNLTLNSFFPNQLMMKEKFDIKELLEQRLEFFTPLFLQKNLELKVFLKSSFVYASKDGIACIIDNLLSNAIKYNKTDGKVGVFLRQNKLCFYDNGYGIEDTQGIFERYVRKNNSQGGFGIGLSLVKELCLEYNLNIKCNSLINQGSSFIITWKYEEK